MAHHSGGFPERDEPRGLPADLAARFRDAEKRILKEQAKELGLGATGDFPEGKLHSSDEGGIKIAIGHNEDAVVINFGKPVAWIGFTPEQAKEIAKTIIEHADALLRGKV